MLLKLLTATALAGSQPQLALPLAMLPFASPLLTVSPATGGIPAAIRSNGITVGASGSVTVTFPGGTLAGDRVIISASSAWEVTIPTGWDCLQQGVGASVNGAVLTRVLTSGDISTGSITISFAGSGSELAEWVIFVGNQTVHGCTAFRAPAGSTLTSWSGALNGDLLFWFGGEVSATSATSISRGTVLQSRGSTPWGTFTDETLSSGGALTATYTHNGNLFASSVAVGAAGTTTLAVRGTRITSFSASSVAYTFPAGSAAGDMCLICVGHAFAVTTPSGWTQLDNQSGSNYNGAVFYKTLSSGDISTGSVTISFSGSFNGNVQGITFVGVPTSVRTSTALRSAGSSAPGETVTTGSSPVSGDVAFYFGSVRAGVTAYPTVNRGDVLAKDNNASCPGIIGKEVLTAGGAVSALFGYNKAGGTSGDYSAIVVIQP